MAFIGKAFKKTFTSYGARRRLAATDDLYLDPTLATSYTRGETNNYKWRRGLASDHVMHLNRYKRSSYRKQESYDTFSQAHAARREQVFQTRSRRFMKANRLRLRRAYHNERDNPQHWYPGKEGRTQVEYFDAFTRSQSMLPMSGGKATGGVNAVHGLDSNYPLANNDGIIFTRRGSVENLMMHQKDALSRSQTMTGYGLKMNHSSFNRGKSVASAGFAHFNRRGSLDRITLASGHYGPDPDSGVALAMWADRHNVFDSKKVPIVDHRGNRVDTSRERRVSAVNRFVGGWQNTPLQPDA